MKNGIALIIAISMLTGCVRHDITPVLSDDYFVMGLYGGYCAQPCFHIFVADNGELFECRNVDFYQTDKPLHLSGLQLRSDADYQNVKSLSSQVPAKLLKTTKHLIGCPGCADGQGLYIELKVDGAQRFWYIDPFINDPELSPFFTLANQKILELTQ